MAHLRYFNPASSSITASINRAIQLVRSQFLYLEEHPHLAPRNYRRLHNVATRLKAMSRQRPTDVEPGTLQKTLDELSFIIANLHQVA